MLGLATEWEAAYGPQSGHTWLYCVLKDVYLHSLLIVWTTLAQTVKVSSALLA